MPGLFFLDSLRHAAHERAWQKRIRAAQNRLQTAAEINHWKIIAAGDASDSFTQTDVIEATFHLTLNGQC